MNKNTAIVLLLVSSLSLIVVTSCNKENETKISSHNSNESHKAGENCLSCHRSGGEGEGHFIVAGTVYDSLGTTIKPNGTIRLYSQPNGGGSLLSTIEVDAKGNFYTTESVDLSNGIYSSATGTSGSAHFMTDINTNGACNSCHGVTQSPIWVD